MTGLDANSFSSVAITPLTTLYVNSEVGLKFSMVLPDYVNNYDDIRITFPSEVLIVYDTIIGIGSYDLASTVVSGQVITVYQRRLATRLYAPSSTYYITVKNITAPPSTKTSDDITVEVIRNGYGKMIGTATIQAEAKTLTATVTVDSTTVWDITSYEFSIIMTDGLSSSGMIKITFPDTITPTISSSCATLDGTGVVTNPTCVYDSSLRVITISGMNSSSSDIIAQTLGITVLSVQNADSTAPSDPFEIETFYENDVTAMVATGSADGVSATVDTIDTLTVTVTPTSYVVLDSSVGYTIQFDNTHEIPEDGSIEITIPS